MKKMGQPTKLTRELADAIAGHMREGCPVDVAAGLEGIVKQTVYNWLNTAMSDRADELHLHFLDAVTRARSEVAREVLQEIRAGCYVTKDGREVPDMRARQWYAERVLGYAPTQHVVADVTTAPQASDDTPEAIEASVTWLKLHKGGE